ncbi:MAG TPA: cell wall-binding repeat-containing protein [Acidimicrobiales bacterium]|nr:cell wall-binding repeat-containing protein [Acidimicrobiales bacterium]
MTRDLGRFRARAAAAALVAAATAGAVVAGPARASDSFTLQRIQGSDRYQTAGAINQAAFPSGEPTALLADGVPGHETDALAAGGLEGVAGVGVFVTDNTTSVPANTLSALAAAKVKSIAVLGGSSAVSPSQVSELQSKGYNVSTPFAGSTRYQTMLMIDSAIQPSQVGKDSGGNPTAILASGDNAHFVDALSAGGLAYAQKFPIILTNSQGPGLQPEAQQVITNLGIKHLIVVGGTASIPTSEYTPPPTGVSQVTVESGSDRSNTSKTLADYAVFNTWLKSTAMTVARGDDGSDALAGAAFAGVNQVPTVVTNSPTDSGSAPAYATEHKSTLAGTSWVFGGTGAVPDSQVSAIEVAGGAASTAPPGTIAPKSTEFVTGVSPTSFVQSGSSYAYGPGDTYQIDTTSSTPGSSPSCTSTSYADFQNRLSQGDQVTGTYAPGKTSTFCLNDIAPPPPSNVTAAGNGQGGGVTVTWTPPSAASADGVTGYQVWRAPANVPNPQAPSQFITCPAAYTVAPGTSPQTPPASASGWTSLGTVSSTGSSGSGTSFSYNDTTASNPNYYCYAVSSVSPNATGGTAPATANPANPAQVSQPGTGSPVQASLATAGASPVMQSMTAVGNTLTLTYNENINTADVQGDGSQFTIAIGAGGTRTTDLARAWGAGSQVFLDMAHAQPAGTMITVTAQNGTNGRTVCAANSTTACEKTGDTQSASETAPTGAAPKIVSVSGSAGSQTVTVTYNEPIDCATVEPSASQFSNSDENGAPASFKKAACVGSNPTASQVTLSGGIPLAPGATVTVKYSELVAGQNSGHYGPVVGNDQSEKDGESMSGSVGQ